MNVLLSVLENVSVSQDDGSYKFEKYPYDCTDGYLTNKHVPQHKNLDFKGNEDLYWNVRLCDIEFKDRTVSGVVRGIQKKEGEETSLTYELEALSPGEGEKCQSEIENDKNAQAGNS